METEIKTDTKEIPLREFSSEGFIRLPIRAKDTPENEAIFSAFKQFCLIETDNNYTQGIRKLLEYYQGDFKLEMIYDKLSQQDVVLAELKGSILELTKKPVHTSDEDDSSSF